MSGAHLNMEAHQWGPGALAICAVLVVMWAIRRSRRQTRDISPLMIRLGVEVALVPAWFALTILILYRGGTDRCGFLTLMCILLVGIYFVYEVDGLGFGDGPVQSLFESDTLIERATQVSTVAFAVGTVLVSMRDVPQAREVTPMVFTALLFCTLSAVPSAQGRNRLGKSALMDTLQKASVSISAGLLALTIACCI